MPPISLTSASPSSYTPKTTAITTTHNEMPHDITRNNAPLMSYNNAAETCTNLTPIATESASSTLEKGCVQEEGAHGHKV